MTSTLLPHRSATTAVPGPARAPARRARPGVRAPSRSLGVAIVVEIVVMGAVFVGYRQVRFLTRGDTVQAFDNAASVVAFERRLHMFSERALQDLVLHSEPVVAFLNRYYVGVHFPATIVFLLWAFARHRHDYRWIRTWFLTVTVAALAIHVAMPLAPPRMLAGHGFVDTLQVYGPRIYSADTNQSVANQFAAMPSLHFGWATMVAGGIIAIHRSRRSLLALAHPLVTLLAIVATANHYWLDAAVALVLVVAGAFVILAVRCLATQPVLTLPGIAQRSRNSEERGDGGLRPSPNGRCLLRLHHDHLRQVVHRRRVDAVGLHRHDRCDRLRVRRRDGDDPCGHRR